MADNQNIDIKILAELSEHFSEHFNDEKPKTYADANGEALLFAENQKNKILAEFRKNHRRVVIFHRNVFRFTYNSP